MELSKELDTLWDAIEELNISCSRIEGLKIKAKISKAIEALVTKEKAGK